MKVRCCLTFAEEIELHMVITMVFQAFVALSTLFNGNTDATLLLHIISNSVCELNIYFSHCRWKMTQFLPPNLLALFAPRDPIPFLTQLEKLPHEKHHNQPYCGIAPFIRHFEVRQTFLALVKLNSLWMRWIVGYLVYYLIKCLWPF